MWLLCRVQVNSGKIKVEDTSDQYSVTLSEQIICVIVKGNLPSLAR